MKNIRKISLLFLSLIILLSSMHVNIYANNKALNTILSIMDFSSGMPNNISIEDNSGAVSLNDNLKYTYSGASTSLRVDFSKLSSPLYIQTLFQETDFSNYEESNYLIKMRAFVENGTYKKEDDSTVTSLVNFVFTQNKNLVTGNPYFRIQQYQVNKDKDGVNKDEEWIEISIPIQECRISGDAKWSHIEGFAFNVGGWATASASYGAPTQLYIDSIWMEAPPVMFLPRDDRYIVKDINTPLALSTNTENTDENKRLFDMTTRMHIFPADKTSRIRTNPDEPFDTTEYNFLNIWAYLPESSIGSEFNVCVYKFGKNEYYRHKVPADWSGWKLISISTKTGFKATESGDWSDVGDVGIFANQWSHDSGTFKTNTFLDVDMIWFSKNKPVDFEVMGGNPAPNYKGVSTVNPEILIELSSIPEKFNNDSITIYKDDEIFYGKYSLTMDENLIKIKFNEELDYDAKHNIEINGNIYDIHGQFIESNSEYSFTTMSEGLTVSKPEFKDASGNIINVMPVDGAISATAITKNPLNEPLTAMIVLGLYDNNGTMIDISYEEINIEANSHTELSTSISGDFSGRYAKAFVCDNKQDLNILSREYSSIYELGKEIPTKTYSKKSEYTNNEIKLDDPNLTLNDLQINGRSYNSSNAVLIVLKDEEGENVLVTAVEPNDDGSFNYDYVFDGTTAKSGKYEVIATALDAPKKAMKEFIYVSDLKKESILKDINESGSESDIAEVINENIFSLGVSDFKDYQLQNLITILYEQKPIASYADIIDMISKSKTLTEKLNNCNWTELSKLLEENASIIMYKNPDYNYYSSLDLQEQNTINQDITIKEYETFKEFRNIFSEAVNQYKKNLSRPRSSNSSGTTTGKKRDSYIIDSSQETDENVIDESGDITSIFTDLDIVDWAKEDILTLYKLSIISYSDDNNYRPLDNVKREEFLKMLIESLEIGTNTVGDTFTDIDPNAWYSKYVSTAQAANIIQGKADGTFGVGEKITRQDMAVMVYRAVNYVGKNMPQVNEKIVFKDNAQITDYAVEAVYTMQQAGIILGIGDGTFAPLENTNRAQAAKVIAKLIEVIS